MPDSRHELIAALNSSLISQRYSPVVARNYCIYASGFLDYLGQRGIPVADVIDVQVEQYLRQAIVKFEKERGRRPSARWHEVPRSGIHALLRLTHGHWPPAIEPTCAADVARFAICDEYEIWQREERGLARSSVAALMWEARNFLAWQIDHGSGGLAGLSVVDVDRYMDLRASKLTRCSLKSVAERLRSLLRYLHITGRVTTDLSGHVIAPKLYAYEGVPSVLDRDHEWLVEQRNASIHTVRSYRDTWRLLLRFVAQRTGKKVAMIALADLAASEVAAFLSHAEHERGGTIGTRNCRLAAIRSFFHFVVTRDPASIAVEILHIPIKRAPVSEPSYLDPAEVTAILAQPDRSTVEGMRDHALLSFLYNSGARIQEALDLCPEAIRFDSPSCVRLTGKGRKERICPLWPETVTLLKKLLERQPRASNQRLFVTRRLARP